MGVYIRNMEKPKSCVNCELFRRESNDDWMGYYCPLVKSYMPFVEAEKHCHSDCPIVCEIPEKHGTLIDKENLRAAMYHEAFEVDTDMQKWDGGCWIRYKMFENCVESAKPIIGAEK